MEILDEEEKSGASAGLVILQVRSGVLTAKRSGSCFGSVAQDVLRVGGTSPESDVPGLGESSVGRPPVPVTMKKETPSGTGQELEEEVGSGREDDRGHELLGV